ncbi:MAG: DMT family transporter [Bacteroidales bacterium]|nr:DMT family transporter [Bacteroidales bacterium]MCF8391647.1 DMT family transporter [Bacteroidales bacterium]
MNNNTKGLLYAGFTAILWGFLAIALKIALYKLNPVTVVWFRFCIAFSVLFISLLIFDKGLVQSVKRLPRLVFLAGFLLGLNYLGFISGLQKTTPGTAQVFIQIGPVSLALVGILFFKEKLKWTHFVGFILLLSGFTLFYSQQDTGSIKDAENLRLGVIYVIFGGLCWAGFSSLQKIMLVKHNPNHLNLVIYGFCVLLFLPFVEFSKLPDLSIYDYLLLVFLGLNTLLAYGSLALALKYAEANKISMILTLNPILTFLAMAALEVLAVSWIDYENFTYLSILGAVLALTGVSIVVLRKKKKV